MMLNNDTLANATATATEAATETKVAVEAESKDVASAVSAAALLPDLKSTAMMPTTAATVTATATTIETEAMMSATAAEAKAELIVANDAVAEVSSVRRHSNVAVNEVGPVVDDGGDGGDGDGGDGVGVGGGGGTDGAVANANASNADTDANASTAKTANAIAGAIAANDNGEEGISVLQQLKAKKNKSNLFLIKSYSFIDKTTNHNSNNRNNNNNNSNSNRKNMTKDEKNAAAEHLARISCVSAPLGEWQNELQELARAREQEQDQQQQQQHHQGDDAAHHKKKNNQSKDHHQTSSSQTREFTPLIDIETLLLEQITTDYESDAKAKKKRQKQQQKQNKDNNKAKQKQKKKTKDKKSTSTAANGDIGEGHSIGEDNHPAPPPQQPLQRDLNTLDELEPEYQQLLRKPMTIHEYEELATTESKQSNSQKRPKSMPTKMSLAVTNNNNNNNYNNNGTATTAYAAKKPPGAGIKRESFLRQSLQSIRRSFSSHKKQQQQQPGGVSTSSASSTVSATGSTGSAGSVREANGTPNAGPQPSSDNERAQAAETAAATRSTSSVNAISQAATPVRAVASTTSMAQVPQRVAIEKSATSLSLLNHHNQQQLQQLQQQQQQQQRQRQQHYCQQLSLPESLHSSGGGGGGGDSSTTTTTTATANWIKGATDTQQKSNSKSLRHNNAGTLNPLVTVQSSSSIRSNASSSNSSGIGGNGSNTAKQHEQQMAAVAASTTASATASSSNAAVVVAAAIVPEKEKKRKEVSSSRVKKFHRHFSQVSKDEKLINYFSCALVSDILLQGHLYITDQHFAFYSNVFGYVTKVVIPTSSVTKISKEKTAKIIPNAVGVATADERHVFGSFISRESAFRLMCSVCPPLAPAELLPKITADIEISEEYSIEDDSSCSISGNESPPQLLDVVAKAAIAGGDGQTLMRRHVVNASSKSAGEISRLPRHSDLPSNAKNANNATSNLGVGAHANVAMRTSAPPGVHYDTLGDLVPIPTPDFAKVAPNSFGLIIAGSISTSTTPNGSGSSTGPSTSSSPTTVVGSAVTATTPTTTAAIPGPAAVAAAAAASSERSAHTALAYVKNVWRACLQRWQDHSELHVLYVGIMLAIVLALFSVFLLYRILDIEAKTQLYNTPVDFNWRAGNEDEDIFAEALRWQRELQAKSAEEAQTILSKNLEQISKVRRSLETLSMLIHDRNHVQASSNHEDGD